MRQVDDNQHQYALQLIARPHAKLHKARYWYNNYVHLFVTVQCCVSKRLDISFTTWQPRQSFLAFPTTDDLSNWCRH